MKDVVIGIDSSTTATKAIAWDAHGRALAQGRRGVPMLQPAPGRFEQNPQEWWISSCQALSEVLAVIPADRIAAVAVCNQRETFAPLDASGNAVRDGIVWLDERSGDEVAQLASSIGAARINAISGRYPDLTPVLYRLAWMRHHEPELYAATATFTEVHAYLVSQLSGERKTSWASADPLGCFDIRTMDWSAELLEAVGLTAAHFPLTFAPGTVLGAVTPAAAQATGLLAGTPVVAGGGDGQCCGLGVNITQPGRAYLNLGTAVVSGLYSPEYRVDPAFRTTIATSGGGYLLETCLRTGTYLLNWFLEQFGGEHLSETERAVRLAQLEREAAQLPLGADGLLVVPHWSGTMTPFWNPQARGAIIGLGNQHTQAHLYRAILEGVALEQRLMTERAERAAGQTVTEFVLIGGGAQSALWGQIIADVTGKPVWLTDTVESSSLGAAILAAVAVGWYANPIQAADAMTHARAGFEPDAAAHRRYCELFAAYELLYPSLTEVQARLAQFRHR